MSRRLPMSRKLPTVLLTGFEPFDADPVNPSQEIARALDGEVIAAHRVVGASLPTEFARALPNLELLVAKHRPKLVLALGLAGGSTGISLERVAINLIDARIADNAGEQPVDVAVVENAPNAYFSTLPIKAMLSRLRQAQIPAQISHSAGTFVCNQVFFGLAHLLAVRHPQVRGGFVHVPWLPAQAARHGDAPQLSLDNMLAAVRLCLETALTTPADVHYAAGTLQ
jgi:pyroglutamyl-peptidase